MPAGSTGGLGSAEATLALVTKQAATTRVATRIGLGVLIFDVGINPPMPFDPDDNVASRQRRSILS
jgi:hypothetical protein